MLRRIALGLVSLAAVPAAGVTLWVATHRADLPSPNDSDLAAPVPEVAADENGYEYLQRAARSAKLTSEDDERVRAMLRGERRDDAWAARLVRANRAAFRELERAIAAPAIVLPDPEVIIMSEAMTPLLTAHMLVRLAALDAHTRLEAGDADGALAASRRGLRLGVALSRAHGPALVSAMIALTYENMSLRALGEVRRARRFDAPAALELARELESYRFATHSWRAVWVGEYQFAKTQIEKVRGSPRGMTGDLGAGAHLIDALPDDFLWQPNRTLAEFAAVYRRYAAAFTEPCRREMPAFVAPKGAGDKGKLLLAMLHGNALGVVLTAIGAPNFERFNTRRCHTESRLSLEQALVALAAYRDAEGRLPDSLDALVPKYLDRVPLDPFGSESLLYDPARGLVHSLGSDFAPATGDTAPSPDDELEPASYVGAGTTAGPPDRRARGSARDPRDNGEAP